MALAGVSRHLLVHLVPDQAVDAEGEEEDGQAGTADLAERRGRVALVVNCRVGLIVGLRCRRGLLLEAVMDARRDWRVLER
jgi:hypothetical protein